MMVFGADSDNFVDLLAATRTNFGALFGDISEKELRTANAFLGPLYYWTYLITMSLILMNLLIAVVSAGFEDTRTDPDKVKARKLYINGSESSATAGMLNALKDYWQHVFHFLGCHVTDPKTGHVAGCFSIGCFRVICAWFTTVLVGGECVPHHHTEKSQVKYMFSKHYRRIKLAIKIAEDQAKAREPGLEAAVTMRSLEGLMQPIYGDQANSEEDLQKLGRVSMDAFEAAEAEEIAKDQEIRKAKGIEEDDEDEVDVDHEREVGCCGHHRQQKKKWTLEQLVEDCWDELTDLQIKENEYDADHRSDVDQKVQRLKNKINLDFELVHEGQALMRDMLEKVTQNQMLWVYGTAGKARRDALIRNWKKKSREADEGARRRVEEKHEVVLQERDFRYSPINFEYGAHNFCGCWSADIDQSLRETRAIRQEVEDREMFNEMTHMMILSIGKLKSPTNESLLHNDTLVKIVVQQSSGIRHTAVTECKTDTINPDYKHKFYIKMDGPEGHVEVFVCSRPDGFSSVAFAKTAENIDFRYPYNQELDPEFNLPHDLVDCKPAAHDEQYLRQSMTASDEKPQKNGRTLEICVQSYIIKPVRYDETGELLDETGAVVNDEPKGDLQQASQLNVDETSGDHVGVEMGDLEKGSGSV